MGLGKVDTSVGQAIKSIRKTRGISMQQLADELGVSHQLIQKYEGGVARIATGRLFEIANALGVPPSLFFEEMKSNSAPEIGSDTTHSALATLSSDPNAFKLLQHYANASASQKRALLDFAIVLIDG